MAATADEDKRRKLEKKRYEHNFEQERKNRELVVEEEIEFQDCAQSLI